MTKFITRKKEGRPEGRIPIKGGIGGGEDRQLLHTPRPKKQKGKLCTKCNSRYATAEALCPFCLIPLIEEE